MSLEQEVVLEPSQANNALYFAQIFIPISEVRLKGFVIIGNGGILMDQDG